MTFQALSESGLSGAGSGSPRLWGTENTASVWGGRILSMCPLRRWRD